MANNNKSNYKKLINAGIPEKCDICGISEWNGEPIKLQVHHKDGDRLNNEINNLQILCPNCHSQTDNWCAKNRKSLLKKTFYCTNCGKQLSDKMDTGLCRDCYNKEQKLNSKCPTKEQLISDCKKHGTYSQISKLYGVSDKTIRKWCDKYNINIKDYPKPKQIPSIKNKLAIRNKYGKPVYQFDSFGNFIKEYPSITEAEKQTGISKSSIRQMLKKERNTAGGYVWRLKYGN